VALGPTQPPLQGVPGALSLSVKRPGREADHSSPSNAEVKNAWSYTSTPTYVFMEWCLVRNRDDFTFALQFKDTEETGCGNWTGFVWRRIGSCGSCEHSSEPSDSIKYKESVIS
jgi:hypothetical protein